MNQNRNGSCDLFFNINAQTMDLIQQQQLQQQFIINHQQLQQQQQQNYNFNSIQQPMCTSNNIANFENLHIKPYVKIIEQPSSKSLRFRYECEGPSAGSIRGVNSTLKNKTYPTIEMVGYKGRAVVVVSCVTKDQPYRPHPHNLVGKKGCQNGICIQEINCKSMRAELSNLGIQCVKKKDVVASLQVREGLSVDPYKTGFSHKQHLSSIDLRSVRLCFQVYLESEQKDCFTVPLAPVVSEPIYDKKSTSDLVICRLSSYSATVLGNTEIILFCEKVSKDNISVRFYEERDGQTIWEAYGDFEQSDVHKQVAIVFKTPRYYDIDIIEPAKVFIQLKRPSDGVTSEPFQFEYEPLESDSKRKRQKTNGDPAQFMSQQLQNHIQNDEQNNRTSPDTDDIFDILSELGIQIQPLSTSSVQGNQQINTTNLQTPSKMQLQQQNITPTNAMGSNSASADNNDELGLSNLLNIDFSDLVTLNFEEQQLLELNSGDLTNADFSFLT